MVQNFQDESCFLFSTVKGTLNMCMCFEMLESWKIVCAYNQPSSCVLAFENAGFTNFKRSLENESRDYFSWL